MTQASTKPTVGRCSRAGVRGLATREIEIPGARTSGNRHCDRAQYRRRKKGPEMDFQSLLFEAGKLGGIADDLGPRVHVSLSLRHQSHAGHFAGLEDSEGSSPKRQKREQAPGSSNPHGDDNDNDERAKQECDDPDPHAACALPRSDVCDASRGGVHGRNSLGQLEAGRTVSVGLTRAACTPPLARPRRSLQRSMLSVSSIRDCTSLTRALRWASLPD
jgi:hypothetical protein